jgi:hypothetical protein
MKKRFAIQKPAVIVTLLGVVGKTISKPRRAHLRGGLWFLTWLK